MDILNGITQVFGLDTGEVVAKTPAGVDLTTGWTVTDTNAIVVTPWAAQGNNTYRIVVDATKTGTAIYGRVLNDSFGDAASTAIGPVIAQWAMTWPGTTPTGGSGVVVLLGLSLSVDLSTRYLLFGRRQGVAASDAATYRAYSLTNLAGEAAPSASADVNATTSPAFGATMAVHSTSNYPAGKCYMLTEAGVRAVAVEQADPFFAFMAGTLCEIIAVRCTGTGAGNETVDVRLGRLIHSSTTYMPPTS